MCRVVRCVYREGDTDRQRGMEGGMERKTGRQGEQIASPDDFGSIPVDLNVHHCTAVRVRCQVDLGKLRL